MRQLLITASILLISTLSLTVTQAQNVQTKPPSVFNLLPATELDVLRVQNGLLSHRVAGTIGQFGTADQWIGIGAPLSSLYGERTQWNGQAFIKALRSQNPSVPTAIKDAILEWGNQGGEMQFRYITNPNLPAGFTRILTLNSRGNAYFGTGPAPFSFSEPKLGIRSDESFSPAISAYAAEATVAEFQGVSTKFGFAQGVWGNINASFGGTHYAIRGSIAGIPDGSVNVGLFGQISAVELVGEKANNIAVKGELSNVSRNGFQSAVYGEIFKQFSKEDIPSTNYAVAGIATDAGLSYAGYFQGNVFCTGLYLGSDSKLKQDVAVETGALGLLKQLNPVTYNYAAAKYKGYGLPTTKQHGLIAQEVQAVLPELVNINRYITKDEEGKANLSEDFLAVNYQGFIPILIKAVQEQQAEIETLKAALAQQASNPDKPVELTAGRFKANQFSLSQNTPNPFSGTTTIRYSLPKGANNATIAVFDLTGKMQLQYANLNGSSQVTINGNTLQPGIYIYSLLVEGQEVVSKRMVLTK